MQNKKKIKMISEVKIVLTNKTLMLKYILIWKMRFF